MLHLSSLSDMRLPCLGVTVPSFHGLYSDMSDPSEMAWERTMTAARCFFFSDRSSSVRVGCDAGSSCVSYADGSDALRSCDVVVVDDDDRDDGDDDDTDDVDDDDDDVVDDDEDPIRLGSTGFVFVVVAIGLALKILFLRGLRTVSGIICRSLCIRSSSSHNPLMDCMGQEYCLTVVRFPVRPIKVLDVLLWAVVDSFF